MLKKMNQKSISLWALFLISSLLCLWFTPVLAGQTKGGDSRKQCLKPHKKPEQKRISVRWRNWSHHQNTP